MKSNNSFREQLRRNAVALISLAVAVTSLAYNTWRNEASEHNRNQRLVAIELLVQSSTMYQTLLDIEYGKEEAVAGNLRKGWALARSIEDLSMIAEGDLSTAGDNLFNVWSSQSAQLRQSEEVAKEAIEEALQEMRVATHELLESLD